MALVRPDLRRRFVRVQVECGTFSEQCESEIIAFVVVRVHGRRFLMKPLRASPAGWS